MLVALLAWSPQTCKTILGPVGFLLGTWLVAGALVDLVSRTGRGPLGGRFARLGRLPRADWASLPRMRASASPSPGSPG
ncbi:MAG: hypothetical protein R3D80_18950 [Paracoccaceae bacterium]